MALEAAGGDRAQADALMAAAGYDFAAPALQGRFGLRRRHQCRHRGAVVSRTPAPTSGQATGRRVSTASPPSRARRRPWRCRAASDAIGSLHGAGFRLGVATNDSTGGAEKTLLALGIAQMFDAAYGYDAVANPKPAPDTIHAFCDLTGLKPSRDRHGRRQPPRPRNGAGRRRGLAIGVLSGTGTRESLTPLADVVLDSIADLPAYLAREA